MTSFFYVVSYCHLSATLQTMSIILVIVSSPLCVCVCVRTLGSVGSRTQLSVDSCVRLPTLPKVLMSIIVETYKTIELWFEYLSHFFSSLSLVHQQMSHESGHRWCRGG